MVSPLLFYQLALIALVWLFLMCYVAWPIQRAQGHQPPAPRQPRHNRTNDPQPFAGMTHKPPCPLCEHEADHALPLPPVRPDPMKPTNRRPREVDTSLHFCPHDGCDYRGWLGLGNLRANGHPSGGPWRQLHCTGCHGYFLETPGTIFHGKRVSVELIIRVLACLAEGLGIRATARVFEVAPNTVLSWLVEAAEQLTAFADSFLCDVHVRQLHLDEWYAVLRGVTTGKLSEEQAIKRLERSRPWVWTAIDPPSKLLVAMDVGARTLEMAQRMVHQVARRVAPTCVPLCLSEGFTGYLPPPSWVIVASGGSLSVAKRKARGPSRVGCRCPGSSLRRSSSSTGVDAW